jgi:phosphoglycolate phosphatase-like HAD superfamily hydrolase
MKKNKTRLLFLDFDGVLCDSLPETLLSSWLGYWKYIQNEMPDAVPLELKRQFQALRPYIRYSEDYILIQDIIDNKTAVGDQTDFDELVKKTGQEKMLFYKETFFAARSELHNWDRNLWIKLNPLFPPLKIVLKKKLKEKNIFVLSTKMKEFIMEILIANNIPFRPENIIDSGQREKWKVIVECLESRGADHALFIDDQISHLAAVADKRIEAFLASWGYVKEEWLKAQGEATILSINQATEMIRDF